MYSVLHGSLMAAVYLAQKCVWLFSFMSLSVIGPILVTTWLHACSIIHMELSTYHWLLLMLLCFVCWFIVRNSRLTLDSSDRLGLCHAGLKQLQKSVAVW